MSDPVQSTTGATPTGGFTVSPELEKQFPEIITLIRGSESMNDEERKYWVSILPVMTPEQVQNLKDILVNEKSQLAAIDQKYNQEVDKIGSKESIAQIEEDRKKKMAARKSAEEQHKHDDEQKTEDILKQIEG